MAYLHPILQLIAIILGLYAFILGINRIKSLHFKKQVPFLWLKHVKIGTLALFIFLLGTLGGIFTLYLLWGRVLVTGSHAQVGLIIFILALIGLISGYYMHLKKKKRLILPLFHGLNNLTLLILSLWQIKTGLKLLKLF